MRNPQTAPERDRQEVKQDFTKEYLEVTKHKHMFPVVIRKMLILAVLIEVQVF